MKDLWQSALRKRTLLPFAVAVLILYLLPLWISGKLLYILVFDNLDSPVVLMKILAESGKAFAPSMEVIPNMMSGLPRLSFGSEYNVQLWLYMVFDPFVAYRINLTLIHLAAFFGMYLLMDRFVINATTPCRDAVIVASALLFGLLPFWPPGGLSVAGLPLLLFLFLRVRTDHYWRDYIFIALFPLYSSLVLSGLFFLATAGVFWLADGFRKRTMNQPFLYAMILLTASYLMVNYRLVDQMLLPSDFISHRTEFFRDFGTFFDSYRFSHLLFLNGQEHTACSQTLWIIPTILIGMLVSVLSKPLTNRTALFWLGIVALTFFLPFWQPVITHRYSLPLMFLIGVVVLFVSKERTLPLLWLIQITISYWHGFWTYEGWIGWVERFQILRTFDFSRFYFLQPLLWFVMLGVAFSLIARKVQFGIILVLVITVLQANALFHSKTFKTVSEPGGLSFGSYYAEPVFEQIKQELKDDPVNYRVVAFGIQPAVLIWNGFYSIDGYVTNYPVAYKHTFAELLQGDFELRPQNRQIFENWGSKCYLTGGVSYTRYMRGKLLEQIQLDTSRLGAMGVRYLFSGYRIAKPEDYGLRLKTKVVDDENSYWDVYVYELDTTDD